MPACVRGCADRRPGIFHTFSSLLLYFVRFGVNCGIKFCEFGSALDVSFAQVLILLAPSLCQHASGVVPIGARGFHTFSSLSLYFVRFGVNCGIKFFEFGSALDVSFASVLILLAQVYANNSPGLCL